MGGMERPELLPDCEVPARRRQPDDFVETCLTRLADDSLGDSWRIGSLQACSIRGGSAMAAASFVVQTGGPWHDDLRRIARESRVGFERPDFTYAEYTVGLCYVAGTKGVPAGLRHRAADTLVHRADEAGYAEARSLLPKNGWSWLADAVREGWAAWTAHLFIADETAALTTRLKVGLALAEHDHPAGYVPDSLERLVAHPQAPSADRLALAAAVARRAPKDSVPLLRHLASDPLARAGHRMEAIGLLERIDLGEAEKMRALQTRLPSGRAARGQHREAAKRAERETTARRERETPVAVVVRLESTIEEILEDLINRGSADWLGDQLDNHIAETDWEGVAQDIADICGVARAENLSSRLDLLEVLTRIRYGDDTSPIPHVSDPEVVGDAEIPRLAREEIEAYVRQEGERAWRRWQDLIGKHGWNEDRLEELDEMSIEVNQDLTDAVRQKAGDHLRKLQQHLVWNLWPALTSAAREHDYAGARGHAVSARLLADEAERAEALWRETTLRSFSFDPLTLSWPRDLWLVFEEWQSARR
ncbi:hypothetical protein HEK616_51850 [Streptomyces nigrescens]|uniref:Uncharacterized protein n=1 Tax=Streptomyces nigrescens TaxID=1920 RepID=A0ABM7ZZB5_STRNI|nr:hypothetical protein [Streptomyces nigrescens]BDM71698.1 hypothetical protein HEK616_51850 [Streptomyces nigrescens]